MTLNTDIPERATIPAEGADPAGLGRYLHHLAHLDMPPAQKMALVEALMHIMRSFVDRAFGEDAAQLCRNPVDGGSAGRESAEDDVIDLTPIPTIKAAGDIALAFNHHGGSDSKERA